MRGKFIQFEARMSQRRQSGRVDPLRPAPKPWSRWQSDNWLSKLRGGPCHAPSPTLIRKSAATKSGIKLETLEHLCGDVRPGGALAIPGGAALGQTNGLAVAEAVLS